MGVVPIPMQQFWRFLFQRNRNFFWKIRRDLLAQHPVYIYIYMATDTSAAPQNAQNLVFPPVS